MNGSRRRTTNAPHPDILNPRSEDRQALMALELPAGVEIEIKL